MTHEQVTMWRARCDADGCDATFPGPHDEVYAWRSPTTVDVLVNEADWCRDRDGRHWCEYHCPHCGECSPLVGTHDVAATTRVEDGTYAVCDDCADRWEVPA